MSKLKILELFGGIGACSKALERLGIDYEIADYVEIDKYAVASYNAMHNTNFEPQDITTWDKDIDCNLIMHGSPCQDFSLAGLQAGGDEGSGTRSSLMYETIRIVEKLKPKYVIWENVKNLISKKHKHNFDAYIERMSQLGYKSYYQVLNAKDYGIPQNRERVFTISILNDDNYVFPEGVENTNKIIEHNPDGKHQQDLIQDEEGLCRCIPAGTHGSTPHLLKTVVRDYKFPEKQELKLKLKDMLEDNVDEKYYLSDKMINYISARGTGNFKNPDSRINLDIARPLTTDPNKRAGTTNYLSDDLPNNYNLEEVNRLYGIFDDEKSKHQAGSVYDKEGLSPTLDTMQGGYRQPLVEEDTEVKVLSQSPVDELEKAMSVDGEITTTQPDVEVKTVFIKNQGTEITRETDVSNTLLARDYKGFGNQEMNAVIYIKNNTKQGYLEAEEGDGVNIGSRMKYQRGNVQKGMSQTITTIGGNERGVVVCDKENTKDETTVI